MIYPISTWMWGTLPLSLYIQQIYLTSTIQILVEQALPRFSLLFFLSLVMSSPIQF